MVDLRSPDEPSMLIARVDVSKLGRGPNLQRLLHGKCNQVFVIELEKVHPALR